MLKMWDLFSTFLIPILCLGFYAILVSLLQEKLIYMPRHYNGQHAQYYKQRRQHTSKQLMNMGSHKIIDLQYTIGNDISQTAYFLAPPSLRTKKTGSNIASSEPFHLWMAASGNAGLALDWLDLSVEFMKRKNRKHRKQKDVVAPGTVVAANNHGFLLVDYPGYGRNDGDPSPSTILESSQKALLALDNYLKRRKTKSGGTTEYDVSYVAHSIGCSAVLQHAVSLLQQGHLAVHRIVLVSPFTTMVDMAKIALPLPIPGISYLLRHQWDNVKRMRELGAALGALHRNDRNRNVEAASRPRVKIKMAIIHGNSDEIVPVEMGQRVHEVAVEVSRDNQSGGEDGDEENGGEATLFDVKYREIKNGDHNRILDKAKQRIFKAMGK
jgi:pimeloyl-ACP methyl ester carboxylesterase